MHGYRETLLGTTISPARCTRLTGDEKHDWSSASTARRALGALRPRPRARRPLSALEGPRAGRVLRRARGEGLDPARRARRLRRLRVDARLPPRPQPRPRRRDLERVARPRAAARRRRCADRPARTFVLVGDGELDEGSNWEAVQCAGRRRARDADLHRGRQPHRDVWLAGRNRGALRGRGLGRCPHRRARPRRARGARSPATAAARAASSRRSGDEHARPLLPQRRSGARGRRSRRSRARGDRRRAAAEASAAATTSASASS